MSRRSAQIQDEIDTTRTKMAGTIDEIGRKTDVKERAKSSMNATKQKALQPARAAKQAAFRVKDSVPDGSEAKAKVQRTTRRLEEAPFALAAGSLAAGFVAGMLLKPTQKEREKLGRVAEQAKTKALETGQKVIEKGKAAAETTVAGTAVGAIDKVAKQAKRTATAKSSQVVEKAAKTATRATRATKPARRPAARTSTTGRSAASKAGAAARRSPSPAGRSTRSTTGTKATGGRKRSSTGARS